MYDVICQGCRGCYHETTEKFDKDVPPKGDMFKEKPNVKSLRLYSFQCDNTTQSGYIECPWCNMPYLLNGKYELREIEKKPKRKYTKRKK